MWSVPLALHRWLRLCAAAGGLALAVALAPPTQAESAQADWLKPAIKCPTAGPHRGCLLVPFELPQDAGEIETREVVELTPRPWAVALVTVNGRLDGGELKRHTIAVNDFSTLPGGFDSMPYLGRSLANRPIILTNRGPLEIVSAGFDLKSLDPETIVVDEKRGVVARYAGLQKQIYEVSTTGVRFWRQEKGRCVSEPTKVPGAIEVRAGRCRRNEARLSPAADLPFARVEALVPELKDYHVQSDNPPDGTFLGDGNYIQVYRVKGTSFLIIWIFWVDGG